VKETTDGPPTVGLLMAFGHSPATGNVGYSHLRFPSVPKSLPNVDTQLWVEIAGSGRRWFLSDARTTGRGLIHVVSEPSSEGEQDTLSVCKSEVTAASEASRYWIDGFLAGNAPLINEYFGDDDAEFFADDDEVLRWSEFRRRFRKTGELWHGGIRPTLPVPNDPNLPPVVWHGFEPTWRWDGTAWAMAEREFEEAVEHDSQNHHMVAVSEGKKVTELRLWICMDCGYAYEQDTRFGPP